VVQQGHPSRGDLDAAYSFSITTVVRSIHLPGTDVVEVALRCGMSDSEKRKFTRVKFQTEVKLTSDQTVIVSKELRDVSLGGAFVCSAQTLPKGAMCVLEIELMGPASLLRIGIEAQVVREEPDGMAVKFTRIDLDSLIHLRHIIAIRSGDPRGVNDEFDRELLEIV
jgi:hypothetical protein